MLLCFSQSETRHGQMSTHTSVLSARVFLQRRQQSRISSFNSPRLSRMVDDLREDPEKRAALDRRAVSYTHLTLPTILRV